MDFGTNVKIRMSMIRLRFLVAYGRASYIWRKTRARIANRNGLVKLEVTFSRSLEEIRQEVDRVWKEFFEKNLEKKDKAFVNGLKSG